MNRRLLLLAFAASVAVLKVRPVGAAETDFASWLDGVRRESVQRGLSRNAIEALADVAPIERVLELDRRQPEVTLSFDDYIARIVNAQRVETGRARLRENRTLLTQISQRFGVQSRFVVALWGIESDFGRITGNFPVISALATLAYDGRRSAFFREELFNALKIIDRGHISAREMRGSWAGAMGQAQFMPSSYLSYAIDYDGNGKADIWTSPADVFASTANYLSRVGWKVDQTWGREVRLPPGFDRALVDHTKVQRPLPEWQRLGVRRHDGGALPARDLQASIIQPGGAEGPAFLIYANYKAILRWNRSLYFATAVGFLADRIGDG